MPVGQPQSQVTREGTAVQTSWGSYGRQCLARLQEQAHLVLPPCPRGNAVLHLEGGRRRPVANPLRTREQRQAQVTPPVRAAGPGAVGGFCT